MFPSRPLCSVLTLALLLAAAPQARAIDLGTVGPFELAFEGLLQVDGYRYGGDWDNHSEDTDVRRAELVLKGQGPGGFDWVIGYDANSQKWLDVNGRFRFADGSQHLRIGQFKQPNGLEELSSSTTNDFIAKAAATNAFAVSRRLGVGWGIDRGDWSVSASWFDRELTDDEAEGQGLAARGTWAPLRSDEEVLHFGLSAARFDIPEGDGRMRARPNADLAETRLLDTGLLPDARRQATLGAEAMWYRGPVKLQAEWFQSTIERDIESDFDARGGYASALWNLTGEGWSYREGLPRTPLKGDGRAGLWQLGLRYDHLDLDDFRTVPGALDVAGVAGGTMDAWTVGVNWYWRERLKVALNYVAVSTERLDPATGERLDIDPDVIEARVQLHW